MKCFFVSSHSEKVKYKGYSFLDDTILKGGLKGGVQTIFWSSRRVKILKMNEIIFVFSHSEK